MTTLASVHLALPSYDRKAVDGLHVPVDGDAADQHDDRRNGSAERSALPCIGPERADLVVAGCAILEAILDIWPAEQLGIADRGIREGILRSLMARDGHAAVSRGGSGGRTARQDRAGPHSVSSTRWLERQLNDPYVRRAKAEGYRSRAAYKLLELDERFGLLKGVKAVVDLGIAPGGWSQVVRRPRPRRAVVGIDLLPTDPIDGVDHPQMDFMDETRPDC